MCMFCQHFLLCLAGMVHCAAQVCYKETRVARDGGGAKTSTKPKQERAAQQGIKYNVCGASPVLLFLLIVVLPMHCSAHAFLKTSLILLLPAMSCSAFVRSILLDNHTALGASTVVSDVLL